MTSEVSIEVMRRSDWPRVAEIYAQGIEAGQATFETSVPTWNEWDGIHLPAPRLVARRGRRAVAWAALAPVSSRCAYRGAAEVSIYVDAGLRGRGVGRALLTALVAASEEAGLWTLEAWVFPENAASVGLFARCGFREVGVRERLGALDGRWRDVLLLERRSAVVGAP
jgi:L-amino acid N-acyltransferase YncA